MDGERAPRETISFAGFQHIEIVYQLLRMMYGEVAMVGKFSEPRVRAMIKACIDNGAVILALEDGMIVGTMGLMPEQWWWSDDWHFTERWTYVAPQYRRSHHAKNMLKAAEAASRQLKVPFFAGVFSDKDHERKCAMFARTMKKVGEIFMLTY